jgi:hypothetical protein
MPLIIRFKHGPTKERWIRASKDRAIVPLKKLKFVETGSLHPAHEALNRDPLFSQP